MMSRARRARRRALGGPSPRRRGFGGQSSAAAMPGTLQPSPSRGDVVKETTDSPARQNSLQRLQKTRNSAKRINFEFLKYPHEEERPPRVTTRRSLVLSPYQISRTPSRRRISPDTQERPQRCIKFLAPAPKEGGTHAPERLFASSSRARGVRSSGAVAGRGAGSKSMGAAPRRVRPPGVEPVAFRIRSQST